MWSKIKNRWDGGKQADYELLNWMERNLFLCNSVGIIMRGDFPIILLWMEEVQWTTIYYEIFYSVVLKAAELQNLFDLKILQGLYLIIN